MYEENLESVYESDSELLEHTEQITVADVQDSEISDLSNTELLEAIESLLIPVDDPSDLSESVEVDLTNKELLAAIADINSVLESKMEAAALEVGNNESVAPEFTSIILESGQVADQWLLTPFSNYGVESGLLLCLVFMVFISGCYSIIKKVLY